jgi:hypothetical protein
MHAIAAMVCVIQAHMQHLLLGLQFTSTQLAPTITFGGCTHVLHPSLPIKLTSLILFMPWKEPNSNTYSH